MRFELIPGSTEVERGSDRQLLPSLTRLLAADDVGVAQLCSANT